MSIAASLPFPGLRKAERAATRPERPRRRSPLFLTDAITPWRDETLLLALLRADREGDATGDG